MGRIDSSVVRHVLIVTDIIVKKKFDKRKEVIGHLSTLIVPRLVGIRQYLKINLSTWCVPSRIHVKIFSLVSSVFIIQ